MSLTRPKTKFVITAAVGLVALAATGGGIWLYQDAKLTEEAEGYAASLHETRGHTATQLELNGSLVVDVQRVHEGMLPPAEILEDKPEVFDSEQTESYMVAFEVVGDRADQPGPKMPNFQAPFDADSSEQDFVDHYRQATADEREALVTEHAQVLATLHDLDATLVDEGSRISDAIEGAHETVATLLDSLPTTAQTLTAELDEASEDAITAAHAAAVFEPAEPDNFSLVLEELTDHLIVYVETVVKAQDNHAEAVAAREKAEKEAAEKAAAEKAAAEKAKASSSSGGREVQQLCSRWQAGINGGYLILVPCR